jgi:hypothetical protein
MSTGMAKFAVYASSFVRDSGRASSRVSSVFRRGNGTSVDAERQRGHRSTRSLHPPCSARARDAHTSAGLIARRFGKTLPDRAVGSRSSTPGVARPKRMRTHGCMDALRNDVCIFIRRASNEDAPRNEPRSTAGTEEAAGVPPHDRRPTLRSSRARRLGVRGRQATMLVAWTTPPARTRTNTRGRGCRACSTSRARRTRSTLDPRGFSSS